MTENTGNDPMRALAEAMVAGQAMADELAADLRRQFTVFSAVMCDCPRQFDPMNATQFGGCVIHAFYMPEHWVHRGKAV